MYDIDLIINKAVWRVNLKYCKYDSELIINMQFEEYFHDKQSVW